MISNQEEDDFIAVRVQDPRIQNEGSWNSYVDYKIFLHTNSRAFTAKTSCVRRRYSEFEWLRKKLQKNAGLVPVPDLPGKSLFSFTNEDFLERRRKGLQVFLNKVLHMTVCLSDSQLHLFLQTQLPVGHIQDCVQGHTPFTVTDAILTYASSNRGLAQAQEDDSIKDLSLNAVSYESMESPAPHQPMSTPEVLSSGDFEQFEDLVDQDSTSLPLGHICQSSPLIHQQNNHLEAIVEHCSPPKVTFFLGEDQNDGAADSPNSVERTQQRSCQIQTPVEVHSPMGFTFVDDCEVQTEENLVVLEPGRETGPIPLSVPQEAATHLDSRIHVNAEELTLEDLQEGSTNSEIAEICGSSEAEGSEEHFVRSEESVQGSPKHKDIDQREDCSMENHDQEELQSYRQVEKEQNKEQEHRDMTVPEPTISEETHQVTEVQGFQKLHTQGDQTKQEAEEEGRGDDETRSLSSSSGSIMKVSEEESVGDEAEDTIHIVKPFIILSPDEVSGWSEDVSRSSAPEPRPNGCAAEEDGGSDSSIAPEETSSDGGAEEGDLRSKTPEHASAASG